MPKFNLNIKYMYPIVKIIVIMQVRSMDLEIYLKIKPYKNPNISDINI